MHNFMLRVEGMYMCIILCSVLQNCQYVRKIMLLLLGCVNIILYMHTWFDGQCQMM